MQNMYFKKKIQTDENNIEIDKVYGKRGEKINIIKLKYN